jgi:hypothetical protein
MQEMQTMLQRNHQHSASLDSQQKENGAICRDVTRTPFSQENSSKNRHISKHLICMEAQDTFVIHIIGQQSRKIAGSSLPIHHATFVQRQACSA